MRLYADHGRHCIRLDKTQDKDDNIVGSHYADNAVFHVRHAQVFACKIGGSCHGNQEKLWQKLFPRDVVPYPGCKDKGGRKQRQEPVFAVLGLASVRQPVKGAEIGGKQEKERAAIPQISGVKACRIRHQFRIKGAVENTKEIGTESIDDNLIKQRRPAPENCKKTIAAGKTGGGQSKDVHISFSFPAEPLDKQRTYDACSCTAQKTGKEHARALRITQHSTALRNSFERLIG